MLTLYTISMHYIIYHFHAYIIYHFHGLHYIQFHISMLHGNTISIMLHYGTMVYNSMLTLYTISMLTLYTISMLTLYTMFHGLHYITMEMVYNVSIIYHHAYII